MSNQVKGLIGMFVCIIFGTALLFWVGQSLRTGKQIHDLTMLMLSVNENRDAMKYLTDIIDDEKQYGGDQFSANILAVSEQRGMTRAYLHRDCKKIALYDKIAKELELKPEMEAIEYCKKNFDVGLGRFE